ncbi:ubiquitin-associated protein 2-like, partial [Lampetra fluviatilis]
EGEGEGGVKGGREGEGGREGGGREGEGGVVVDVRFVVSGVSVASSNSGVPDISGSVYSKTQVAFDKQGGFHAATPPPPFSLPSALGASGALSAPGGPAYGPAYMAILPPPQAQLHSHMDSQVRSDSHRSLSWTPSQGNPGQRVMQQKSQQPPKPSYTNPPYWAPN